MTNIDEIPVSCASGYNFEAQMQKMEEEFQRKKQQEEAEFNLPLPEKIASKNWKCRKSALDELSKKVSALDSPDPEVVRLLPKVALDPHQGNLEFALEIINKFLDKKFPLNEFTQVINELSKNLVEKCFTVLKPSIKDKAREAIVKSVENLSNTDAVCEHIGNMLNSKNQKFVQGAVQVSTFLLSLFGAASFNYKLIMPNLIKLVDSAMPTIRNDIIEFMKELYKWIRGGIKQYIENKVKDSVKVDLDKAFEDQANKFRDGFVAEPTKFLGRNTINFAACPTSVENSNKNKARQNKAPIEIPMGDDCEVDVFTNKFGFGEKFVEEIMKPERKWKEKKEMFDNFCDAISPAKVVKIKNTNRTFFIEMLKIMLKDPNINVIHSIINCIGNLSKGLRENFNEGRDFFSILIEFFKEKKEKLTNDLMNTLMSLMKYIDDGVLCDLIIKYSNQSLTNQSKEKVCSLIEKIAKTKNIKSLIDNVLVKFTDDPVLEVRNAAIKALAGIRMFKESLIISALASLNEVKIKKIDEICATQGCNTSISESSVSNSMAEPRNNKKNTKDKDEEMTDATETVNNNEIEEIIKAKIGEENFNNFNESKWDVKRDAFKSLSQYIVENKQEVSSNLDSFFKFISLKNKNFKDNNINILKESLITVQTLSENCPQFSKKYAMVVIKKVIDKISDQKIKSQIHSLFNQLIQSSSAKQVILTLIKSVENKPAVILKETAIYITSTIETFGISNLPIKEIVDFCKCLEVNSNPQCRNSATALLCNMYKFIGEPIKNFLRDIKDATMKVIEEEFKKVKVVAPTSAGGKKNNLIESLFPRVDISKKITPKMLKDLNEGKWQTKKEVIDAIDNIINEANKRILPNGLNEFVNILKQKLKDGNKNIIRILIQFITRFAESLGIGMKVYTKTLLNPILKNLSDKMLLLREDVVACLEKIIEIVGYDSVAIAFPPFLNEDNFEMRSELLKLLMKYKANLGKFEGIKEFVPGAIACLLDKNPVIRQNGEEFAKELLRFVNINVFYANLKDFKPAIANSIKAVIDKYSSLICEFGADGQKRTSGVMKKQTSTGNLNNQNPLNNCQTNQESSSMFGGNTVLFNNNNNNMMNSNMMSQINALSQMTMQMNIPPIVPNNANNMYAKNNQMIGQQITQQKEPPVYSIENNIAIQMDAIIPNTHNSTTSTNSISLSRSPLFVTKTKSIFDASAQKSPIQDQNSYINSLYSQSLLSSLISKLYTGEPSTKSSTIIELGDFITNSKNLGLLIQNIKDIFTALNTMLSSTVETLESSSVHTSSNTLRYLLTTYYRIGMKKEILSSKEITVDTLYVIYEKLLSTMLNEKIEKNSECKQILKSLNAIVLKFMENFEINHSICALIKLIGNYRLEEQSKLCSMGIKCLLKLSNIIHSISNEINFEELIKCLSEFFHDFGKTNDELVPRNQNDDMSLKVIKNLLNELIKIKGNDIWADYQKVISTNNFQDKYLKRWIQLIIRNKNGMSQPVTGSNPSSSESLNKSPLRAANNILMSISKFNSNVNASSNGYANELLVFADRLNKMSNPSAMTDTVNYSNEDKEKAFYEIVSILKRNKLNVEYMADKLNQNNYAMLLKIYHSLTEGSEMENIISTSLAKSQSSGANIANPISVFSEKENIINPVQNKGLNSITKNISTQLGSKPKTLQEYRNKLYGLSGNHPNIYSHTGATQGNQMDSVRNMELDEIMKSNREKMNSVGVGLGLGFNRPPQNPSMGSINPPGNAGGFSTVINSQSSQVDRLTEMKKKLEFLRRQKL